MLRHTFMIALFLTSAGCDIIAAIEGEKAPPNAANSDRGQRAVKRYADAKKMMAKKDTLTRESARDAVQAALDCRGIAESMVSIDRRSPTETVATVDGEMTLEALQDACDDMRRQFKMYRLEEPPKAVAKDEELEARALETLRAHAKKEGWKESFEVVRILTPEWHIRRHPMGGQILSHSRSVAVGAHWPDGHCTFQEMAVVERHDGNAYSDVLRFGGVGSQRWTSCEHVTGERGPEEPK